MSFSYWLYAKCFLLSLCHFVLFYSPSLYSQECIPFGKTFKSQEEIDDFSVDYPNCTIIQGKIYIRDYLDGTYDITNLDGFSDVIELQGGIEFDNNPVLEEIAGFENLTSLGGDLHIRENPLLTEISSFSSINVIGGDLLIAENEKLFSAIGLNGITSIGGSLSIFDNELFNLDNALPELEELGESFYIGGPLQKDEVDCFNTLKSVGRYFSFGNLKSIDGFQNLETIGLDFDLSYDDRVESIQGFNKLKSLGGEFYLISNTSLIEIPTFDALESINGDFYISLNPSLLNLNAHFPTLKSIGGSYYVYINESLENLAEFPALENLGGEFQMFDNENLSSITGFDALKSIAGDFFITGSNSLENIDGFLSLEKITGDVEIWQNEQLLTFEAFENLAEITGSVSFEYNPALISLASFSSLTKIAGSLNFRFNDALSQISGFANIDPSTIKAKEGEDWDLVIYENPMLDDCAIKSICDYFDLEENNAFIDDNGASCDNEWDIKNACTVNTESEIQDDFLIFPNPASTYLSIKLQGSFLPTKIEIIDIYGKSSTLLYKQIESKHDININHLIPGLYQLKITSKDKVAFQNLIVF